MKNDWNNHTKFGTTLYEAGTTLYEAGTTLYEAGTTLYDFGTTLYESVDLGDNLLLRCPSLGDNLL